MTRPSMQRSGLNCRVFSLDWREAQARWLMLAAALALVSAAGCGTPAATNDANTGPGDGDAADADVKINHPDVHDADSGVTDVADDVPDAVLPDGSDTILDTSVDATPVDDVDASLPDGSDVADTSDVDAVDVPDVTIDVPPNPCNIPANPPDGTLGASCNLNDDCDFGYCVDTPDGKMCTIGCTNTCCPGGWECANISASVNPVYGCVPSLVHACDPCTDDSQCHSPADSAGLCISYGDVGSFCGGTCATNTDCPASYYCLKNAKGTKNGVAGAGGTGSQCMKISGQCECSLSAKALGLSTTCQSKNKYGACSGGRQCQPSGLTGCDAKSPTAEVCNGLDDNCDGVTDEPGASLCTVYWQDSDKDGFGNSPATGGINECLCQPTGLFTSASPTDCNDANAAINPNAIEVCDGIDNNCNGLTDETADIDKDGYCAADVTILPGCKACKYAGVDCDDGNPKIHPGQPEICGNGIDDDCDGQTDSGATDAVGCTLFYEDGDKDGYGTFNSECLCAPSGIFTATVSGDCNDSNASVHPGAPEVCGNGIDDNCNGKQDEAGAVGCTMFYKDADSDGYGDMNSKPACLCAPSAVYSTAKGGDCNDNDPKINPGMTEVCNNIDDDCDGITDNNNALGCSMFYADYDKDGFGDSKKELCLCAATDVWTATIGGDCNDSPNVIPGTVPPITGAAVNPVAKEVCNNVDDDCNGIVDDPGAQGCVMAYEDADGDGFGNTLTKACICGLKSPYNTYKDGDCDDTLAEVYPGAPEKCNGIDDNCNGVTDEENALGCTIYYYDSDHDGVGNSAKAGCFCAKYGDYTATIGGDCNDSDPTIHPGAVESCDFKDNDCDGIVDNPNAIGCITYWADSDGDGYGDIVKAPTKCLCSASGIWDVTIGGDCNDDNNSIHPGATEKCNGVDDDCDGTVDPPGSLGCQNYYPDMDNDGWGDEYATNWQCLCGPMYPFTSPQSMAKDCNDHNPLISPGAFEICGDKIDNNCNGLTDENTTNTLFYVDADNDGYGTGTGISLCKPGTIDGSDCVPGTAGCYCVTVIGDCNDSLASVHPNATEVCNGIDDNCNGQTDEQLPSVMCGSMANADPSCIAGKCTPQCYADWFDADGVASDGCECKADAFYGIVGGSCTSPVEFGYLYDDGGVSIVKSGNIMPGEQGDWFHFRAIDSNDASQSCDPFNVHVWLSSNPDGNFIVDLYRGGCGTQALLCGNETDTEWTVSFNGKSPYGPQTGKGQTEGDPSSPNYQPSPIPEMGGECKCVNGVSLPGMNQCTDNSADFYVRVGRYPGTGTICQNYQITITNGNVP